MTAATIASTNAKIRTISPFSTLAATTFRTIAESQKNRANRTRTGIGSFFDDMTAG